MRLDPRPTIPESPQSMVRRLVELFVRVNGQVNNLTEGRISADHSATTAAPTTGTWIQGDEVRNSAPTEAGTASSKYVIVGWKCVASGTPGTWVEMRCLTGN